MGEQYHLFPSSFNALKSHIDFKLFTGLYWPALLFNQSKSHPSFLWGGGGLGEGRGWDHVKTKSNTYKNNSSVRLKNMSFGKSWILLLFKYLQNTTLVIKKIQWLFEIFNSHRMTLSMIWNPNSMLFYYPSKIFRSSWHNYKNCRFGNWENIPGGRTLISFDSRLLQ